MSTGLHPLVQSGFVSAMTYDTYRPSYPVESVDRMLDTLGVFNMPKARILEIGAGTGKLTEQLVAHEKGYEIIAVEPHVHMRQVLDNKALSGVKVMNRTATNLEGVEEAWADAVVIAQVSFVWSTSRPMYFVDSRVGFSLVCTIALSSILASSNTLDHRFANFEA